MASGSFVLRGSRPQRTGTKPEPTKTRTNFRTRPEPQSEPNQNQCIQREVAWFNIHNTSVFG